MNNSTETFVEPENDEIDPAEVQDEVTDRGFEEDDGEGEFDAEED